MNIVIPMAGFGERFSKAEFKLPKPLILVADKPMYRYAIDCLPLSMANKLIFIIRKDGFSDQIEQDIYRHYGSLNTLVITLNEPTRGQAETVLQAKSYLDLAQPILIHNCDTFISGTFNWDNLSSQSIDGAIVLFKSQENRWSYAKVDENRITQFREKQVISSHASTGTYYFKNTHQLMDDIKQLISENKRENNEFYLSTIYQMMIDRNAFVLPLWTTKMLCFGTPQDLVDSLNILLEKVND